MNPGVFRFKLTTTSFESTQIAELVILYGPRYGRSMRLVSITRYSKYYLSQYLTNPGINSINNDPTI